MYHNRLNLVLVLFSTIPYRFFFPTKLNWMVACWSLHVQPFPSIGIYKYQCNIFTSAKRYSQTCTINKFYHHHYHHYYRCMTLMYCASHYGVQSLQNKYVDIKNKKKNQSSIASSIMHGIVRRHSVANATIDCWFFVERHGVGVRPERVHIQWRHVGVFDAGGRRNHRARHATVQCANHLLWLLIARIMIIVIEIGQIGKVLVVEIGEAAVVEWLYPGGNTKYW